MSKGKDNSYLRPIKTTFYAKHSVSNCCDLLTRKSSPTSRKWKLWRENQQEKSAHFYIHQTIKTNFGRRKIENEFRVRIYLEALSPDVTKIELIGNRMISYGWEIILMLSICIGVIIVSLPVLAIDPAIILCLSPVVVPCLAIAWEIWEEKQQTFNRLLAELAASIEQVLGHDDRYEYFEPEAIS